MSEMIVSDYQRGIAEVTRDIRIKTGQFLMDAIEIGRLLFEAKAMVDPGRWMQYVAEELPFSHSWANNYMRLYKELGGEQISLFGNSQALVNLSPTQALELLALPAQERDEFVQTHDVENMSTRELHQAIKERDEALRAQKQAEAQAAEHKAAAKTAKENEDRLLELSAKANAEKNAANEKVEKLQKQLEKAKANEKAAKEALIKAQENPEIPENMMESMRQQVAADAAREATESLKKELDAANKAKASAEQAARDAEQKLVAAQKQLQLSSPEAAVFKTLFEQVQEDFNRLRGALLKVQQADPGTGAKLQNAVCTLLEKLQRDLKN